MAEAVKVIVRCRPLNQREKDLECGAVVTMDTGIMQVQLRKPKADGPPKLFTFDGVYYMTDSTQQIYDDICFPLVANVLEGYNGTVFAYGQTGCGKSYTMVGVEDPVEQVGIIPRAFDHIFDHIAVSEGTKYIVRSSYLEIYNEEVRDLLGKDVKKKLELKEHPEKGVYVAGLSSQSVHNRKELEHVMEVGSKNRSMGATLMNVDSSRSHCIFTIDIEMMSDNGGTEEEKIVSGKLNLVDLAGSERQSKTGATGDRLKEATKINLSLSALGNVISALVDGKSKHIPYRDSKLTRLLQSSLGGNTKTLMVACISPADNNYDETLSTLRYANRAKNIKNKPKINEDPKDALLREYQEEIKRLKEMLSGQVDVHGGDMRWVGARGDDEDRESEIAALRAEYESKINELQEQYGKEQSNRSKLEEEMTKLKLEYETQLTTRAKQQEDGGVSASGVSNEIADDHKILLEHEAAIQKLSNLQDGMVGGEKAGDANLKETLESRKRHAEERETQLKHSNAFFDDDDHILERIFNNLTDEVRMKTSVIERTQIKLKSAEDDIKDLQGEFEEERQDLLDTIRKQEKELQLHKQLVDKMVPLIRRDCNYYNVDKIKVECKYDEENSEWILPKVVHLNTTLSSVPSKSNQPGQSPRIRKSNTSEEVNQKWTDEQSVPKILVKPDNTDYFKPKRAQEILVECSVIKGSPSVEKNHKTLTNTSSMSGINKSPNHAIPTGTSNSLLNIETQFIPLNTEGKSKPRKLDSLSRNYMLPAPPSANTTAIEHVDRIIALKKTRQLDPLPDHNRKQF